MKSIRVPFFFKKYKNISNFILYLLIIIFIKNRLILFIISIIIFFNFRIYYLLFKTKLEVLILKVVENSI